MKLYYPNSGIVLGIDSLRDGNDIVFFSSLIDAKPEDRSYLVLEPFKERLTLSDRGGTMSYFFTISKEDFISTIDAGQQFHAVVKAQNGRPLMDFDMPYFDIYAKGMYNRLIDYTKYNDVVQEFESFISGDRFDVRIKNEKGDVILSQLKEAYLNKQFLKAVDLLKLLLAKNEVTWDAMYYGFLAAIRNSLVKDVPETLKSIEEGWPVILNYVAKIINIDEKREAITTVSQGILKAVHGCSEAAITHLIGLEHDDMSLDVFFEDDTSSLDNKIIEIREQYGKTYSKAATYEIIGLVGDLVNGTNNADSSEPSYRGVLGKSIKEFGSVTGITKIPLAIGNFIVDNFGKEFNDVAIKVYKKGWQITDFFHKNIWSSDLTEINDAIADAVKTGQYADKITSLGGSLDELKGKSKKVKSSSKAKKTVEVKDDKQDKSASSFKHDTKKEKKSNTGLIVSIVLALLLIGAGVFWFLTRDSSASHINTSKAYEEVLETRDIDEKPAVSYDSREMIFDDYFLVSQKNKYGVVDGQGKIIIPIEYNSIEFTYFEGEPDHVLLSKNGKVGIASLDGKTLVGCDYDSITYDEDIYWAYKGEKLTKISLSSGVAVVLYEEQEDSIRLINGYEAVDLGLSVMWATCNVGASKPEDYGRYYQWAGLQDVTNTNIYLDITNCPYHIGSVRSTGWTKYVPSNESSHWSGEGNPDNKSVLDYDDDVAHTTLGGSWRIPSRAEWEELIENCDAKWTKLNGVNGQQLTSKKNGNSIFLPAAGFRYDSDLNRDGEYGSYCSSSLNTSFPDKVFCTSFDTYGVYTNMGERYYGESVRPVSE